MMNMRRMSLVSLLLALLFAITACSGGGKGSGSGKTLSIMWWGPDERHEATKKRWTCTRSSILT